MKEQTASLYAKKLAQQSLVTVCYDASHQGESGGVPQSLDDPAEWLSDIWSVVDYLSTLKHVHPNRLAVVGVCAGGYATATSKVGYRFKALATISMVTIDDSGHVGWAGDEDQSKHVETLKQVAQQITAEVIQGAELVSAPYVPLQLDVTTLHDGKEAYEYFRCQHPRAANKMLLRSVPRVLNIDAYHEIDLFWKQPTLLIVGEDAESRWSTEKLLKIESLMELPRKSLCQRAHI